MPIPSLSDLKRCFKCGREKPRGEFYAHPQMGDGLLGKCKECTKRDVRDLRAENIDDHRDRDRKRWPQKRAAMKDRGYVQPTSVAERRANSDRWALKNVDKRRAHFALNNAVRDGRIEKHPCFICGDENSQGHHEDYSKPLAVVWLCSEHHQMWHRLQREVTRVMANGDA